MKDRIAFFCWRPFQLFTIINLVMQDKACVGKKSDLYIQNNGYLNKYRKSIECSHMFEQVIWFDEYDVSRFWIHLVIRWNNFFPESELRMHLTDKNNYNYIKEIQYKCVFSSGWNPFFVAFAISHKESKFIFFEDGIASYLLRNYETRTTNKKDIIEQKILKLFGRGLYAVKIEAYLTYAPQLMEKEIQKRYRGRGIPALTDEVLQKEKKIFLYDDYSAKGSNSLRGKTVFLTPIPFKDKRRKDSPEKEPIVKLLIKYRDEIIVRRHPTDIYFDYWKLGITPEIKDKYVWEIAAEKEVDGDTVIIAEFSSAQLTPFFLYKKTPVLIFLYKYTNASQRDTFVCFDNFIDRMREIYDGMIYTPETYGEIEALMERVIRKKDVQRYE